jgi:anti-anti-sigma factor
MGLEPMGGGSDFPLDLRLERVPGSVILRAHGEIDLLTVPALREHLTEALETGQRVVVDLSSIDFIGVAGVSVLEEAQEAYAGRLAVIGSKPSVRRVLEILELDTVVPILPGRQAALEFLKA